MLNGLQKLLDRLTTPLRQTGPEISLVEGGFVVVQGSKPSSRSGGPT